MKSLLFITLLLIISCETPVESNDVVEFYKCLLLDSDTVYNHLNSLLEAVRTLDPIKLATSFSSIYPAIGLEVTRCSLLTKKNSDDNVVLKVANTKSNTIADFFKALLKVVTKYIMPFLNPLGFNLKKICNEAFPDTFICDLL